MKKTFSKILISVIMMGIFIMPLSPSIELKNREIIASVKINKASAQPIGLIDTVMSYYTAKAMQPYSLECSLMKSVVDFIPAVAVTKWIIGSPPSPGLGGCIAQLFYYIWQVSAILARAAGGFLDFFVFYSIDSASYKNAFVTNGWGLVRDVSNIFFIVALLYVALKTILGLNVSDNKRLIGTIIVVALLINFSLFTTRVVIDASNIIAKIFYTSITAVDGDGQPAKGAKGERSVSVGLVSTFDPQHVIDQKNYEASGGIARFIFVTLILIGITLYTAYIFFSVALLFLARVIGLWISMIFAPLAFASHTVSFKIPGFGHDDWWPELFKTAFLAPIFVFFLYMIIMFMGLGLNIVYNDSSSFLQKTMSTVIPFSIIFILLMKAKEIAVEYSGKLGAAVMSAAKMAGGLAGGMALGAAAVGGRAVLGRVGSAIANDSGMKAWAARSKVGSALQKGAMKMESGSFDLRQVKIKGKGLGSLTGMDLGDGKKGGFKQAREDRVKRRQHRAEELKVGEDEELNQNVRRAEVAIAEAKAAAAPRLLQLNEGELDQNGHPVNGIAGQGLGQLEREATRTERVLSDAERNLKDVIAQFGATSQAANTARTRQAIAIAGRDTARTNVNDRQALIRAIGANTHHAQVDLQMAQNAVIAEDRTRLNHFADRNNSVTSNVFTVLTGGSWKANREASNKIRASAKQESSTAHH